MAEVGREVSPDDAASRAYYAAFHAVSALFSLEGKTFKRHSAVENEVHFSLVHSGKWTKELGAKYKALHRLRMIGDYGSPMHVTGDEAVDAIESASEILRAVSAARPEIFPFETQNSES